MGAGGAGACRKMHFFDRDKKAGGHVEEFKANKEAPAATSKGGEANKTMPAATEK